MKYPYPTHLKRLQAACTLILCFFGTCRKLCYLDGGLGCDDEADVCRQPSESWPGLGYCASACVGPG